MNLWNTYDLVLKTNPQDLSPVSEMKKEAEDTSVTVTILWLPLHGAGSGQRATQPPKSKIIRQNPA